MKPEYKTRKNTDFKLIKNENNYSLTNFLKEEYPYILQSMKYEKYKIEYEEYEIFHELIYENKVIGILSLVNIDDIETTLCINEVYILPEFRHKGIFFETLLNLLTQPNITISIKNPNRKIIDILIKYRLAKKLKNNLVLSYIDFYVDDAGIYTNKQIIHEYDEKHSNNEVVPTDFYDLNINSCVFMEIYNLKNNKINKAYIIKARLSDSKEDKYYNLLKNVDLIYLEKLKERIFDINVDDLNFLKSVREQINEFLDIDDIIGTKEELTPVFKEKLKEHNLSIEDGFNIRSKVSRALKNNEIIPKSIVIRTLYLLENYNNEEVIFDDIQPVPSFKEKCPYCSSINSINQEVCNTCGHYLLNEHEGSDNFSGVFADKILYNRLPSDLTLKKEKNIKQDKINNILKGELDYLDYDEDEVYQVQNIISTYQFLKNIEDIIYFEIFNYDILNNIQEGSTFQSAKENKYFKELKNYQYYIKLMEDFYPEKILKEILDEHNYNISGEKEDLIKRIECNINPKDIFGDKYVLTSKGNDFLLNKDYIENYLENLTEFTFYEYKLFYEDNKDKSFEEINEKFVQYMHEIALKTGNYYKYHDIIRHKIYSSNITKEEFMILFTALFIMDINYWIKSRNHRKNNKPLSKNVVQEYPEIKILFSQSDIDELFDKAINTIELDDLKNNYVMIKFYLKKSLEYNDIDDINREIEYNTFKEEYLKRYSS